MEGAKAVLSHLRRIHMIRNNCRCLHHRYDNLARRHHACVCLRCGSGRHDGVDFFFGVDPFLLGEGFVLGYVGLVSVG